MFRKVVVGPERYWDSFPLKFMKSHFISDTL